MKCYCVLLFWCCLYVYNVEASIGTLDLSTTPTIIKLGVSRALKLNCNFQPSSDTANIVGFAITQKTSTASIWTDVAVYNSFTKNTTIAASGKVKADSYVDPTLSSSSHIRVTFLLPDASQARDYRCMVSVLDKSGRVQTTQVIASVQSKTPDKSDLIQGLRAMQEVNLNCTNDLKYEIGLYHDDLNTILSKTPFYAFGMFDNHIYFVKKLDNVPDFTVAEAQKSCESVGGYLVEINTQSEYSQIKQLLDAPGMNVDYNSDMLFIGATDEGHENVWKNLKNPNDPFFPAFEDYSSSGTRENAATLKKYNNRWQLYDTYSQQNGNDYYFICEIP